MSFEILIFNTPVSVMVISVIIYLPPFPGKLTLKNSILSILVNLLDLVLSASMSTGWVQPSILHIDLISITLSKIKVKVNFKR